MSKQGRLAVAAALGLALVLCAASLQFRRLPRPASSSPARMGSGAAAQAPLLEAAPAEAATTTLELQVVRADGVAHDARAWRDGFDTLPPSARLVCETPCATAARSSAGPGSGMAAIEARIPEVRCRRRLFALALLGGLACACDTEGSDSARVRFRTAKVERGEVVEGVQASGTVQPLVLVQVGTQVSGVIERLLADFNSKVHAGETIAVLDPRRLQAQVAQDEAALARSQADTERMRAALVQARAEVERICAAGAQATADVERAQARLTQAERECERQETLAETRVISAADVDIAVANRDSSAADLASALAAVRLNEAQVASAQASVEQSESQILVGEATVRQSQAQLDGDRVNLDYATIVSPIDGVVISRNVDVGQTVAASLQAPTLFVIANDLTKIQVQTSVPEADIGRLHEGQRARFTVDAHPELFFEGRVSQVRLAATTVQNVVTYTVVLDAPNPEGLLLPGMTANVTFEIRRSAPDALHVPASALRLRPPEGVVVAHEPAGSATRRDAKEKPAAGERAPDARVTLYTLTEGEHLRPIAVKPGLSDSIAVVVEPLDPTQLAEGTEVVTAVLQTDQAATTNPFGPPQMGAPRGVPR